MRRVLPSRDGERRDSDGEERCRTERAASSRCTQGTASRVATERRGLSARRRRAGGDVLNELLGEPRRDGATRPFCTAHEPEATCSTGCTASRVATERRGFSRRRSRAGGSTLCVQCEAEPTPLRMPLESPASPPATQAWRDGADAPQDALRTGPRDSNRPDVSGPRAIHGSIRIPYLYGRRSRE